MSAAREHAAGLQKEYRRQELIQSAFLQLAERGFEGLRTRDVASAAGVNIATLHYYFPTKEALIRGVVGHAMGRFRTTLTPHSSSRDRLANHLRQVRLLMRNEPELRAVMGELALRSARDASLARIMRETHEAWHRTLRGMLRRAVREGGLAAELDSDETASLIITTLMAMALPSIPPSRGDQAVRELERWLRQGTSRPRVRSSK